MHRDEGVDRWLLTLLALTTVALFLLLHPYRGLVHDSHLYTLQALNWLHPDVYGSDVFLRHGSQDNYTLFSPLYGWTISWLGLEPAAAAVAFVSILLFLAASLMLARTLLPPKQALVALLLLLLIPAHYGPAQIFHYLEEFVTPRQLAEALALLGMATWLKGWRLLATALAVGAMLIHPIIGLAGAALLLMLEWVAPRWRKLWPLAALAGLAAVLAASGWLPISRWQFDEEWHRIVMHRTYLGLRNWSSEDWARIAAVLATLTAGSIFLKDRLQQISMAAVIVVSALLLLAFIGGDLLRVVIVVQAQPWRALWLGTVLAIVLLPPLYVNGWQYSPLARCALLLLAAAWMTSHGPLALVAAPLAVAGLILSRQPIADRPGRLLLLGSWFVLFLAVLHGLAVARLTWSEGLTAHASLPPLLDRLLLLNHGSVLLAVILLIGGYLALRFHSRLTIAALAVPVIVSIAAVATTAAMTWTTSSFGNELRSSYGNWRALIPPGSDVLWTGEASDRDDGAFYTWILLERPSFMSRNQAPNALFSRPAALEMYERSKSLRGLLPFWDPFGDESTPLERPLKLEPVCRNTKVRYIVTKERLADATPMPAPRTAHRALRDYSLYICP